MLKFSQKLFKYSSRLTFFKYKKRWFGTNIIDYPELTQEEQDILDTSFAAIKEDKQKLIIRGDANAKLINVDPYFYVQAIDSYVRAAKLEGVSLEEQINIYGKCAHLSGENKDLENQKQFVSLMDTLFTELLPNVPEKLQNNPINFYKELSYTCNTVSAAHEELANKVNRPRLGAGK